MLNDDRNNFEKEMEVLQMILLISSSVMFGDVRFKLWQWV